MGELARRLAAGEVSSREATQACLDRIAAVDGEIRAFLTVDAEGALAQADAADATRAAFRRGGGAAPALLGVPLGVKDNLCTRGVRTTCASKILANFVPPYDATVVRRLREAGRHAVRF